MLKLIAGIKQDEQGRLYFVAFDTETKKDVQVFTPNVKMPTLRGWRLDHYWVVQADMSRLPQQCRAGSQGRCNTCNTSPLKFEEVA